MEEKRTKLKDIVKSDNCPPLVFLGSIDKWPASRWTVDCLSKILEDRQLQCKIAPLDHQEFQWETESLHMAITLHQYQKWLDGCPGEDNPLRHIAQDKFSCYIDYKYMNDVFESRPDILKDVDWSVFGLDGRDGKDSTLWVGSAGTYTPCHQDTYGFNLVAQISGRKRWYLFDPGQTVYLYPTRLPYEESSVYSDVNIWWPDLRKHPLFSKVKPYVVELKPGDVLYVPKQWWHFVESLEPAISINSWVPMESDSKSRMEESVCRLLYSSLSSSLLTEEQREECLNSGEVIQPTFVNLQYVKSAVSQYVCKKKNNEPNWFELFVQKFAEMPVALTEISEQMSNSRKRKWHTRDSTSEERKSSDIKVHCVQSMTFPDFHMFLKQASSMCNRKDISGDTIYSEKAGQFHEETCDSEEDQSERKLTKDSDFNVEGCKHCSDTSSDQTCHTHGVCRDSLCISETDILKATLDPRVIQQICQLLLDRKGFNDFE